MNTPSSLPSRVPPQNLEAEKAVLGSLLLEKDAITRVADLLAPTDFYAEAHRVIFENILDLYRRHVPIDMLTLTDCLVERAQLDMIGGRAAVAELTEFVPTASHIVEYAEIVREKATLRRLINAGSEVAALGFKDTDDLDAVLDRAETCVMAVRSARKSTIGSTLRELYDRHYERMAQSEDDRASGVSRFLPTGLSDLDRLLNGLHRSDLVILAARPALGKTALAINIAKNVAKRGTAVGVFSLEMSEEQITNRILSGESKVDSWKIMSHRETDTEQRAVFDTMERTGHYPLIVDDTAGMSLMMLRSRARRMKVEANVGFIVIDYLQLMSGSQRAGGNRVQEISELSRGLKVLARELDIPILALSQLSRAVESRDNKVPNLSDLRESGSIEQDADIVIFMYRDDYYKEESERPGEVELHIKKHRNGPTGKVLLMFDAKTTTFRDIDEFHAGMQPPLAA